MVKMDKAYEKKYYSFEKDFWWFWGRRKLVSGILAKKKVKDHARIIDVGCSSGTTMRYFKSLGYKNVFGIDLSERSVNIAKRSGLKNVKVNDALDIKYRGEFFDVLLTLDVLEHIPNDKSAIKEWARILKKDGIMILMVPAFDFLWSYHDKINNHQRRYSKKMLVKLIKPYFKIQKFSYWNFFGFLPHMIVVMLKKNLGIKKEHLNKTSPLLNKLFKTIISIENWLILNGTHLPFGVSCLVIAKKR